MGCFSSGVDFIHLHLQQRNMCGGMRFSGYVEDGEHVVLRTTECVSVIGFVGVGVRVNGGALIGVIGVEEVVASGGRGWVFELPLGSISPGDGVVLEYEESGGEIVDCEEGEDVGDFSIGLVNELVAPPNFVTTESGSFVFMEEGGSKVKHEGST